MSDISGIFDEVFYSLISKCMDGEVYESDDCVVVVRYGELNEYGRIVVVFIRICYCGKYENKKYVFKIGKWLVLFLDGVDVYKDENCEYVLVKYFDFMFWKFFYWFKLYCYCVLKKGIRRYLDYN